MLDFKPNYNKCRKPQKEIYHNVCRHITKKTYMFCGDSNNKCVAWSGYKHVETITNEEIKAMFAKKKIKLKRRVIKAK